MGSRRTTGTLEMTTPSDGRLQPRQTMEPKQMEAELLEANLRTDAAARQLVAARLARRPGARLAESCRPRDNETALAIQRRVGELLHFDVGGWKCSLPTTDKAAFMAPICAPTITSVSPCSVLSEGGARESSPKLRSCSGVISNAALNRTATPTCAPRFARRDWCWSS